MKHLVKTGGTCLGYALYAAHEEISAKTKPAAAQTFAQRGRTTVKRKALNKKPVRATHLPTSGLPDAGGHLIKAGLVVEIDRIIQGRQLTQSAAAQLMRIDQAKVSAMLAGHFRGYSRAARALHGSVRARRKNYRLAQKNRHFRTLRGVKSIPGFDMAWWMAATLLT
ncbi:MAG: helix-turn-helix domain-containing protein [Acidobacteriota bacterium]|nr:helix-turn-helix domain-containing protein [Acidobacteriota bacterium]